jgi:hypothetical protein
MKVKLENLPRAQKINCIKAARWAFANSNGHSLMGLKEAKDAVEAAMIAQPKGDTFSMQGTACYSLATIRSYVACSQGETGMNGCSLPQVKVSEVKPLKIKSKGMQLLNVPNTEEGRNFMDDFAKYLNRPRYSFKKRGRGSRKEHGDQASIDLQHSEWVAVYVNGGSVDGIKRDYYATETLKHVHQVNRDLEAENKALRLKLTEVNGQQDAEEARENAERLAAELNAELNALKPQLDLAVEKAEEYRERLDNEMKRTDRALRVAQTVTAPLPVSAVKRVQPMPPMTFPLANGSKVKVIGATEIKSI